MSRDGCVSVPAARYAKIAEVAGSRGVSISSIVEAALADLPPAITEPREVLPISHRLYAMASKVARRRRQPIAKAFEDALAAALDDAERYPAPAKRARRAPMVAHASRRAA